MKHLVYTAALPAALILGLAGCASGNKSSGDPSEPSETPAPVAAPTETPTPAPQAGGKSVTCTNGKDQRIIEVVARDPKGCELKYTKQGNTEIPATSSVDSTHCENVQKRIQSKLEQAGFKCE